MLVRAAGASDAALAEAADIDIVEHVVGDGSGSLDLAASIRKAFTRRLRLRFSGTRPISEQLGLAASLGADEVAAGIDDIAAWEGAPASDSPELVAVIAAPEALGRVAATTGGIMLEPAAGARLIDAIAIGELDAFAGACRAGGVSFGLAGGLEAPDVARLLLLEPDVLGFDAAVRVGHAAAAPLDRAALDAIRGLVPREPSGARHATAIAKVVDRIFVRDFEIPLAIGAYRAEHVAPQRVRFSVDADVARDPAPPRDMRDVFSYDIIIETIRVLSQRPHVTFVESLAEEVAAALLAHAEVRAVNVRVEKLDIIHGSVGIEIVRRRDDKTS